ncbi:MAG: CsbD family protein [Cyanobacteriota bacterium]
MTAPSVIAGARQPSDSPICAQQGAAFCCIYVVLSIFLDPSSRLWAGRVDYGFKVPLNLLEMLLRVKSILLRIRAFPIAFLAPIVIMGSLMLSIQPAMASQPFFASTKFGTMSNKIDAAAKDAEGKLESAYGELTGDPGHQIKGKAKQVQASAMNVAEDVKEGARSAGKKIADATGKK